MNKKILAGAVMFGLFAAYALPLSLSFGKVPEAQASQSDYYLKIDTVDGESTAAGHDKEMQVMSWSFGASNPTSVGSGGMSAGKVHFQDFHFTKTIDKASPKLFLACVNGKHIPKAELTVAKPSADGKSITFMKYTFADIMVTSCTHSADPLIEELSFTYQKISMEYTPMTDTGKAGDKVIAGWDIKMNKAI